MDYSAINNIPTVYLKTKRKELGLTQDEFADLFGMKTDCYRKYEEGNRTPPDYVFHMMKIVIDHCEKGHSYTNLVSDFLESVRQDSLTKIFCKEQHDVVNMVFDYITRKAEQERV